MESLSSGPASSANFSNKDRGNLSSSTAKDETNVQTSKEDAFQQATVKQDKVPTMVIISGSTDIADRESNNVNTFDLTNAMTPNSTQLITTIGPFDLTEHNWNVSHVVTELGENHSHGGIAVSDHMYSYLKKSFQGAKEDHVFIHVGNKDRSDDGLKNIDFIKITNTH
eukprot:14379664-Ditylum_brightwellii.AAC.1